MQTLSIRLPTMYGDHHVIEVRRLLSEMSGIQDVFASSCFQTVEVHYDPAHIDEGAIRARLDEAGYTEELPVPVEREDGAQGLGGGSLRHSAAYEHVGPAVSFAQVVGFSGRALWPCPGLGVIARGDDNG
jgi:copper chaperone CopZ